MADDILNIVVKLGGDWQKFEDVLQKPINLKLNAKFDKEISRLLEITNKNITITVNTQNAQSQLKNLVKQLQDIQNTSVIRIGGSNAGVQQRNAQRAFLGTLGFSQGEVKRLNNQQLQQQYQLYSNIDKMEEDFARRAIERRKESDRQLKQAFEAQRFRADAPKREASAAAKQAALELKNFRQGVTLKEANLEFQRSPFLSSAEGTRERIAFQRGILPSQITSTRKFIDPGRLKEPGVAREIAFATLFGQGIGGKAAGFAGGIAGASLAGSGGALLGAAGAQLAVEGITGAFEGLKTVLDQATEKGKQFQQAVVSIGAVLNQTTELVGPGGQALSSLEQIQGQQRRAEALQLSARENLLPLGIAGEAEAAYARSIATGIIGKKGINLNAGQFGKFAGALGAAQIALRPDLTTNPNRLLRDLQDITSGSPAAGRTELGIALGELTKEIGNARTVADIERLTNKLEKFREAVTNSDKAAIQLLRLEGAFDKIFTSLGDALLQAQSPGFKNLANALGTQQTEDNVKIIGAGLGAMFSMFTSATAAAISAVSGALAGLFSLFGIKPPAGPDLTDNTTPVQRTQTKLDILSEELGINPLEDFTDIAQKNPFFQGRKLAEIADLINNSPNGSEFLPQIQLAGIKKFDNAEDKFNLAAKGLDTNTLAGKLGRQQFKSKQLLEQQGSIDFVNNYNSQYLKQLSDQGVTEGPELERANSIKELMTLLQAQVNAGKSILAGEGIQNKGFEIDTSKKLGDALKQLGELAQDQADKFRDLDLSLEIATQSLNTFALSAQAATAGKEAGILGQASSVFQLNGTTGSGFLDAIVSDPELMRQYQAKAAAGELNAALASVGLSPVSTAGAEAPGFISPIGGGTFQLGLEQDRNSLSNTIKETSRDLSDLDRVFKSLKDSLKNTIDYLNYLLTGKTSPDTPGSVSSSLMSVGPNGNLDSSRAFLSGGVSSQGPMQVSAFDSPLLQFLESKGVIPESQEYGSGTAVTNFPAGSQLEKYKEEYFKSGMDASFSPYIDSLEFGPNGLERESFGTFPALDTILQVAQSGEYKTSLAAAGAANVFGFGDKTGNTSALKAGIASDKGVQAYSDIVGAFVDSNLGIGKKGTIAPLRAEIPNANLSLSRLDNQLFNLDKGGGAEFKSQKDSQDSSLINAVQQLPTQFGQQMLQSLQNAFAGS